MSKNFLLKGLNALTEIFYNGKSLDEHIVDVASAASLPVGGTTGQVLTKTSNADEDAAWATPAGGLLTGNLVWVDAVNGDDATGAAGDASKPFLTIQAAVNVASSGNDTVVMRPGSYGHVVLKDGVNLHFMANAKASPAAGGKLFDDGGFAVNVAITGDGEFLNTGASVLLGCSAASVISIRGRRIVMTDGIAAKVTGGAPTITVDMVESITAGQIVVDSGSTGATRVSIKAPTITATVSGDNGWYASNGATGGRYTLDADVLLCNVSNGAAGATLAVRANKWQSHRNDGYALDAHVGSLTQIDVNECLGVPGQPGAIVLEGTSEVHVMRGRIVADAAGGSPIKLYANGSLLRVYQGAILVSGDGVSPSIDVAPAVTPTVKAFGAIPVTVDKAAGVTIAVGSLLVDAAVA